MSLTGKKSKLASKTVWGGAAALLAPIVAALGYQIASVDAAGVIDLGTQIVGAIGGLVAIVGRVTATKALR